MPVAVCTSSRRVYLDGVLAANGWERVFAASVAQEDTDQHKPRPDPYLEAAARLGVDPAGCVVVEDTPPGVAAARAAGMTVVAVDRGMGLDLTAADRVVTSLTVADLAAVPVRP